MTLAYSQQLTIDHVLNTCLNHNVCYKKLPASSYRQHCGPGTIGVPYSVEVAIATSLANIVIQALCFGLHCAAAEVTTSG